MIVSDATTLIILFQKIYIPQTVYNEISFKKTLCLPDCMQIVEVEKSELLHDLKNILDDGESEAIAFAKERNLPLIIDEKKGRKVAQNLNLRIIGLIGIVYLNIKKKFLSEEEAKEFFEKAIKSGYRINQKLINDMLESL